MKSFKLTMIFAMILTLALGAGFALASASKPQKIEKPAAFLVTLDKDNDGKISQAEYVAVYKDKVQAARMFEAVDKDGNGYLVTQEYQVSAKKLDTPHKAMDKNKDGKVDVKEFVEIHGDTAVVRKQFEVLDKNGDGYLVTEELVTTMEKLK